jgi:arabinofuranan 3-O-arabinosyltransferase
MTMPDHPDHTSSRVHVEIGRQPSPRRRPPARHRSLWTMPMNDALEKLRIRAESSPKPPASFNITSGWGIENKIFTEQRLLVYGSIVAVAYAIGLVSLGVHNGLFASHDKLCIDFTWMWVSGAFARSSDPARLYDVSAWSAAWTVLTGLDGCHMADIHFDYPPTFLLITYPLGLMPYSVAFVVWMLATLLLYLAAVYVILPRPAAVIAAFTPIAVPVNVLLGHNGFFTAGLIGLSLVLLERRPRLSGIFLGFLTYKPQFGVLFPLALLASRNWRVLVSATATSLALGVAAAAAFGYRGWPSFIASLFDRNASLSPDRLELRLTSIYGVLHWVGASASMSWTAHCVVAAIVALTVWFVWAKSVPHSLKAAILCVGSITATPYLLPYDFCILSIAVAFFVRDGLSRGFLPGERVAMLICFASLFLFLGAFAPTGPFVCAVMLFLIARRVVAYRGRSGVGQKDEAGLGSNLIVRTC